MLMITEKDNTDVLVYLLAGMLCGDWAAEFQRCWVKAIGKAKRARIVVDLTDVTFVDDLGKEVLAQIMNKGGEIIAQDVLMKSIVEQISMESSVA